MWLCCCDEDPNDTPWCGYDSAATNSKLYLQSGQFTSTTKTSQDVSLVEDFATSISWDGADTPWAGVGTGTAKLLLQSGQFTSTIKTSEDVFSINETNNGISWDGTNTPWCGSHDFDDKLYVQSGQFSSTLKTSEELSTDNSFNAFGISWDGADTPWAANTINSVERKIVLQSGQFTSTIKTSEDVESLNNQPADISWDGTNTPWCGNFSQTAGDLGDPKLYLTSGQFSSTLKTSLNLFAATDNLSGINTTKLTVG